jgi:hypothetical protein
MIRGEDRRHEPREPAQERLVGADPPVVDDLDLGAVLREGPAAGADEVADGVDRETGRRLTVSVQRSVYGSQPLVNTSRTRPVPSAPAGPSSRTSR